MRPRPPSLLTRIVLAVVAAFALVFFVLGGIIVYLTLDSAAGQLPRQIRQVTDVLGKQLASVEQEQEIARIGTLLDALQRENEPRGRLSWTAIVGPAGRLVYAPEGVPDLDWSQLPDGTTQWQHGESRLNLFAQAAGPWRIVFIDRADARQADVVRQIGKYLLIFLAIALLLVLPPVWLATRSGLTPLRRLSEAVGTRRIDDLTPISLPAIHRELEPLVNALNGLMSTLAQGVEREKSFVHDAAHELRTPLAVISTQAHLLASADTPQARAQAEQQLLAAVQRASHLVHQLLRLAQLDAGSAAKHETFDLMALVRDCVADFAVRPEYARADLGVSGPDTLACQADRNALQSIVENLLDNALRYGGPLVRVDIDVGIVGSEIRLLVADNGPGIPEAQRPHVFERFHRGDNQGQSGSGLGLAIVAQAAKAVHGEIALAAGENHRGCRFTLTLRSGQACPT